MKERGSQVLSNEQTTNEHPSTPHLQKIRPPERSTITILGHTFESFEHMPHNKIPNAEVHYYVEKETNLNITIIEYGLNDSDQRDKPIPLRLDHGCPCMVDPLDGHDCAQQREIAKDSIIKMGRGMIVLVDSAASASNGHGTYHVINNAAEREKAKLQKQTIPTIPDYLHKQGISEIDIRNHDEVAALVARRLKALSYDKSKNPIILLGTSPKKIESLNKQGISIDSIARVVTNVGIDPSKEKLEYGTNTDKKEGVFLEITTRTGETSLVPLIKIFPFYKELGSKRSGEKVVFDRNNLAMAA